MNIKVKPLITEKSLLAAESGKYTFKVPVSLNKHKIREVIGKMFSVTVIDVRTMKYKGVERRNVYRKKITSPSFKKAIVTLADKQKINIFTEKK